MLESIQEDDPKIAKKLLKIVNQLRKNNALGHTSEDPCERSDKLLMLKDILTQTRTQSSGILIFTHYRATGSLLQKFLMEIGEGQWDDVAFVHGGFSEMQRQEAIESFRSRCMMRAIE